MSNLWYPSVKQSPIQGITGYGGGATGLSFASSVDKGGSVYYNDNEYLPMYEDNSRNVVVLPISGKGLWSTLFGYFAIDSRNYSTVRGITFYKHKETPGLGGEVSKKWFQSNFIGKEIYENNNLNSVKVAKAGYADKNSLYEVDGISGATITSNGVTTFLLRDLKRYEKYFMKNLDE